MRPAERAAVLSAVRPHLNPGDSLYEDGQAVVYLPANTTDTASARWYIDCPSYLGSVGTRQIGRVEPSKVWRRGYEWTEKTPRFTGKGWEQRIAAEFLRLTGLVPTAS